jgi:uncharacterized DUF497 family protein
MGGERDDDRRQRNLVKHRVDFVQVQLSVDGRPLPSLLSRRFDDERFGTTEALDGRFYTVTSTCRTGSQRSGSR